MFGLNLVGTVQNTVEIRWDQVPTSVSNKAPSTRSKSLSGREDQNIRNILHYLHFVANLVNMWRTLSCSDWYDCLESGELNSYILFL